MDWVRIRVDSAGLADAGMTQLEAARVLGITQAQVSGIRRGKINQFSKDPLVRLASRAGVLFLPSHEIAAT
jgi:predicted XRE-type DNA-binding protein